MPTVITTGGVGNLPTTDELKIDMSKKRMAAFPSLTPLTVIMARNAINKAHNVEIDLIEEHEVPTTVVCATTEGAAGTSVSVQANGTTLVLDTLLFNPRTFDIRRVNAAPTSNDLTVAIDQGGTTSAAWQTGDVLHVMLPALNEDDDMTSGSADAWRAASMQDTNVYNYVQLSKLQFSITRTMNMMTTNFGGPGEKRKQLTKQKYREYRIKQEKMKYFGGRASSGTAPTSRRMQGGLVHYLRNGTLYHDYNGVFTESGFDEQIGNYHDQNPDAKVIDMLCAGNVIRQINYMCKDKIRLSPSSKKYGLNLNQYIGGAVSVNLIELPLLTDPICKGWSFFMDFTRLDLRDIDPPTLYKDAKAVGESELIIDTYRGVESMLIANESRHAMHVGATG